jgi:glycosyltransferase involved in cell wall biosynthesis
MVNILYLTGREHTYSRNDVLLRALERLGTVERVQDSQLGSLFLRSTFTFIHALPKLLARRYDLVFVGFYGHLLMLPVGILSRSPLLFDAFVSTYDTLCFDRRIFSPQSLPGRLAFWLDKTACNLASSVLVDTPQQVDYFVDTFNLAREKVYSLPVGCNEEIFFPRPAPPHDGVTAVLYYSTYHPLHGADTVVRAAALLKAEIHLRFELIGTGPGYAQVRQLVNDLKLSNVSLTSTVPLNTLASKIASADICLGGHFGNSSKAARVIPGKIFHILAMGKPLIASKTLANEALLTHAETAYLCQPDSAEDLAQAIFKLHQDTALRERIAAAGRALYLERCSEAIITEQLKRIIGQMVN